MPSFSPSDTQVHFARTIALGPAACPTGLFAGHPDRVLRGLKVHANTISHARLVALEDTYPRTRDLIGADAFNTLSHGYLDAGHGHAQSLDRLGDAFPHWLENNAVSDLAVELARFERAWLESYHAPEAEALTALHLAQSDAPGDLRIGAHPAARQCGCSAALADLLGLTGPGDHVLLARPDAEVLVHRIDHTAAEFFTILAGSQTLSTSLETFAARQTDEGAVAALQRLLCAGALSKRDL